MSRWKVRLLGLLAAGAMIAVVQAPAMADDFDDFGRFDGFDDAEVCFEVGFDAVVCDGELFVEADNFNTFDLFDEDDDDCGIFGDDDDDCGIFGDDEDFGIFDDNEHFGIFDNDRDRFDRFDDDHHHDGLRIG